jgi:UV DNA damage endonuclease
MLSLLKLPPQQNRDAVMILHMGGVYGDKAAALDRFRMNYKNLSQDIKNRLVLENDDVSWSVHDLLPICEELNIPLVLDFHHHNIIFDEDKLREGTLDIMQLYERIAATWTRKGITQKMHYSEPTPSAITNRQRRKHSPRVATLPPCDPTMDLMIEAKDKEQAVFELMRNFKLPGFDKFNDMIPHVRTDENKPVRKNAKKTAKNGTSPSPSPPTVPDEDVGMGGLDRRVYWPPEMEHWLRPAKRIAKTAHSAAVSTKKTRQKTTRSRASSAVQSEKEQEPIAESTPRTRRGRKKVDLSEKTVKRKRKVSEKSPMSSSLSSSQDLPDVVGSETASSSALTPVRRRSTRAKVVNYKE